MNIDLTFKTEYTVVVAFRGTYMQTVVEADTTFEALEAAMAKMKTFHDDKREIVSVTITEKIVHAM